MNNIAFNANKHDLEVFRKNWGWFLVWGILLTLLGAGALSAAVFTTLLSVILLGAFILAGGLIMIIDCFHYWRKKGGFSFNLLMGLLYFLCGLFLVCFPGLAATFLTLILASLFILIGISRIFYASKLRLPGWGWSLFSGVITLLLGILIIAQWPLSGLMIIGIFVGVDLLFLGITYVMAALLARSQIKFS